MNIGAEDLINELKNTISEYITENAILKIQNKKLQQDIDKLRESQDQNKS